MAFARVAIGLGLLPLLLLGLAGPLYRMGALSLPAAFGLLRWGAYLGALAAAVALVAAILAYRRRHWPSLAMAAAGLCAGVLAFGVPAFWMLRARGVPPIHDISTDLENPPVFQAIVARRADAPNSLDRPPVVAEQQRKGYPDLAPVTLPQPAPEVFDRALSVAQRLDWEIVTADKASGRLEATDTTRWFGFQDDVIVRLTPWGAGTRVDVRSVSRVGLSDVGTNARRIRAFLGALQSE